MGAAAVHRRGIFIPGLSSGVKATCVALTLALLAMLAYYLLPWEVWLKRRIDRGQGGSAV